MAAERGRRAHPEVNLRARILRAVVRPALDNSRPRLWVKAVHPIGEIDGSTPTTSQRDTGESAQPVPTNPTACDPAVWWYHMILGAARTRVSLRSLRSNAE